MHLSKKQDEVMAGKGNHTIAVVNGIENYETIQVAFKDVFAEINSFIEQGSITVKPIVRLRATLQYCHAMLVF